MTVSNFTSRSYGPNGWQRMLVGDDSSSPVVAKPAIIYVPGGGWGLRDPLPFTDVATSTFTDPVSWAVQNPLGAGSPAENDHRLFVLNVASDANQSRAATGVTAGGNNPTGIASNTTLSASIGFGDTSLAVAVRGNLFPKGGYIKINSEIIKYTAIDETVDPPLLTGLSRAQAGTTGSPHTAGDAVTAQYWVEGEYYPSGTILRGVYRARRGHTSTAGSNQPGDVLESATTTQVAAGGTTFPVADGTVYAGVDEVSIGGVDGAYAGTNVGALTTSSSSVTVTSTAGFPDSGVLRLNTISGVASGITEYAYYTSKTATTFTFGANRGWKGAVLTEGNAGEIELYLAGDTLSITNIVGNDLTVINNSVHNIDWPSGFLVAVPSDYYWENIGTQLDEAAGVQRIPGRGEGTPAYAAQAALDVQLAVSHIRKNAAELNVDPGKITVYGSSAGGHAVAIAAYGPDLIRTAPVDPRSINAGRMGDGRPNAVMLDITPAFLNEYVTTNVGNNGLFLAFMRDAYGIKSQGLGFSAWQDYPEDYKKSLDGAALISATRKTLPTIFISTAFKYSDRSPSQVQNGAAAPTAWNSGTAYTQYDTVAYNNKFWIAQGASTNSEPGTNYDNWAQAGGGGSLSPEVHHAYNGWRYMRELEDAGETQLRLITADDLDPAVRDVRVYTQVPTDPSDEGSVSTNYTVTSVASAPKAALVTVGNAILAELAGFLGI